MLQVTYLALQTSQIAMHVSVGFAIRRHHLNGTIYHINAVNIFLNTLAVPIIRGDCDIKEVSSRFSVLMYERLGGRVVLARIFHLN